MQVNDLLFQRHANNFFNCYTCGEKTKECMEIYKSGGHPVIFPICEKCQKNVNRPRYLSDNGLSKESIIKQYLGN